MKRLLLSILVLSLGTLIGCGQKEDGESAAQSAPPTQAEDAAGGESAVANLQQKAREAADKVSAYSKEQKDALVQKMQSALQEAGSLDNLRQSASNALGNLTGGNAGASQELLKKANEAKNNLQERLAAVREATPDNWEEVKVKAEDALARFQAALKDLREG
jgi:hypothetical protein